jgi:hypothetical protein
MNGRAALVLFAALVLLVFGVLVLLLAVLG